jgi:hypothetical protein
MAEVLASSYVKKGGVGGGGYTPLTTATTNTKMSAWDTELPVDTTTGIITINLPTSSTSSKGKRCYIRKISNDNNPVCIKGYYNTTTSLSESINNKTDGIYLYNQFDGIEIISDGIGTSSTLSGNISGIGNTSSYLYATLSTPQTTNLTAGSLILFNSVKDILGSNVSLNTSTGIGVLKANSTYSIKGSLQSISCSASGYCNMIFQTSTDGTNWKDVSTSGMVSSGQSWVDTDPSSVFSTSLSPTLDTYIRCIIANPANVVSLGNGGTTGTSGYPWIEIKEEAKQINTVNITDSMFCYKTSLQSGVTLGGVLTWDKKIGNMKTSGNTVLLKAGRTYEITTGLSVTMASATNPECGISIYNSSTNALLSDQVMAHAYSVNNANHDASTGGGCCVITPTSDIYVDVRMNYFMGTSSVNVRVDGTWLKIRQIGSTPVLTTLTNTTEYGDARYTGNDTGGLTTGSQIMFDANLQSGNMTYTNSMYLLTANKTYDLESFIQIYNSGGAVAGTFTFWDYTNNVELPNCRQTFLSESGNIAGNPNANGQMKTTYTPSSNISVGIKLVNQTGYGNLGIVGNGSACNQSAKGGTYFLCSQKGSTAITNVPTNLLSSTPTNFTPIITAVTTNPTVGTGVIYNCEYWLNGNKMLKVNFNLYNINAGNNGSGNYRIQIPNGYRIDTNRRRVSSSYDASCLGIGFMSLGTSYGEPIKIIAVSATELAVLGITPWNTNSPLSFWSSTNHGMGASLCVSFDAEIPIA